MTRRTLLVSSVMTTLLARRAKAQESYPPQAEALIARAREVVCASVERRLIPVLPNESRTPAKGVFVTIERDGHVLGCRGTLRPHCSSLEAEVTEAARSAAGFDPRYRPLTIADLKGVLVTVTVVDRLEPLDRNTVSSLSPEDGLVLTANGKTGVVLPYEGKEAKVRLNWAYRKAGVADGVSVTLWRMVANRYRG